MAIDDPRGSKREHEEEYFRKQDQELIDRMRKTAAAESARRELGERTGLQDPELIKQIEELGFTPDTVSLLPMIPLLHVAWAEGGVSAQERKLLLEFARKRGIAEGSAADQQLSMWLDTKPAPAVFNKARRMAAAILAAQGAGAADTDDIVRQSEAIAAASGGVFGIGKVSAEERAALDEIAAALKKR